ncbi:fumarylacetoacetate hydrolase family protein [Paraburkholderia sp. SIMBA_049]
MKLCRFGDVGHERPGILDMNGSIRDLSSVIDDVGLDEISPSGLAKLRAIDPQTLPLVQGSPRMGAPWKGASKFIAIGLNYVEHARESGLPIPDEPVVFLKATTSISGPCDNVVQPRGSTKLDWEVELGVVIGTKAQYVDEQDALDYVAGYCVVNDVSERAFQMQSSQWDKGKGCDTFGPVGPWLVSADEVADPQGLDLWLEVNGKRMQDANTRSMIFPVARLVSYVSRYMTLLPGDVITTGTPTGVGLGVKPNPVYLKPGDTMRLGISGLGEQQQRVVSLEPN